MFLCGLIKSIKKQVIHYSQTIKSTEIELIDKIKICVDGTKIGRKL